MDSATPLEPAPAVGGRGDGGISFAGQAKFPSFTGGWRHLPLISRRKPRRRRHLWDHGQVQHDKVRRSLASIRSYAAISPGRNVEKSKNPVPSAPSTQGNRFCPATNKIARY